MQHYLKHIPNFLKNLLSNISKNFLPTGFKGRNYLQNINSNFKSDLPLIASYFDQNERYKQAPRRAYWS